MEGDSSSYNGQMFSQMSNGFFGDGHEFSSQLEITQLIVQEIREGLGPLNEILFQIKTNDNLLASRIESCDQHHQRQFANVFRAMDQLKTSVASLEQRLQEMTKSEAQLRHQVIQLQAERDKLMDELYTERLTKSLGYKKDKHYASDLDSGVNTGPQMDLSSGDDYATSPLQRSPIVFSYMQGLSVGNAVISPTVNRCNSASSLVVAANKSLDLSKSLIDRCVTDLKTECCDSDVSTCDSISQQCDKDVQELPEADEDCNPLDHSSPVGQENEQVALAPHEINTCEIQRSCVIREIVETEHKYCASLWTLLDRFAVPLKQNVTLHGIECDVIFPPCINFLYAEHCDLLKQLESRLISWHWQCIIGDIVCRFLDVTQSRNVLALYETYVQNFPQALEQLHHYYRVSTKFKKFIKNAEAHQSCASLEVSAFMLAPVQRVPRYVLLFKQLMKYTNVGHPDYYYLQTSLDKLADFLNKLNDSLEYSLNCSIRRSEDGKSHKWKQRMPSLKNSSRIPRLKTKEAACSQILNDDLSKQQKPAEHTSRHSAPSLQAINLTSLRSSDPDSSVDAKKPKLVSQAGAKVDSDTTCNMPLVNRNSSTCNYLQSESSPSGVALSVLSRDELDWPVSSTPYSMHDKPSNVIRSANWPTYDYGIYGECDDLMLNCVKLEEALVSVPELSVVNKTEETKQNSIMPIVLISKPSAKTESKSSSSLDKKLLLQRSDDSFVISSDVDMKTSLQPILLQQSDSSSAVQSYSESSTVSSRSSYEQPYAFLSCKPGSHQLAINNSKEDYHLDMAIPAGNCSNASTSGPDKTLTVQEDDDETSPVSAAVMMSMIEDKVNSTTTSFYGNASTISAKVTKPHLNGSLVNLRFLRNRFSRRKKSAKSEEYPMTITSHDNSNESVRKSGGISSFRSSLKNLFGRKKLLKRTDALTSCDQTPSELSVAVCSSHSNTNMNSATNYAYGPHIPLPLLTLSNITSLRPKSQQQMVQNVNSRRPVTVCESSFCPKDLQEMSQNSSALLGCSDGVHEVVLPYGWLSDSNVYIKDNESSSAFTDRSDSPGLITHFV